MAIRRISLVTWRSARLLNFWSAPTLWLHGHTHAGSDYQVGRCRVVANPAGYVRNREFAHRDDFVFENETFDRNLIVALPI